MAVMRRGQRKALEGAQEKHDAGDLDLAGVEGDDDWESCQPWGRTCVCKLAASPSCLHRAPSGVTFDVHSKMSPSSWAPPPPGAVSKAGASPPPQALTLPTLGQYCTPPSPQARNRQNASEHLLKEHGLPVNPRVAAHYH